MAPSFCSISRRELLRAGATITVASLWPGRARAESGPRLLVLGDSMIAGAFGLFLERALKKSYGLPVRRVGKSSSGLARPDFYNWPKVAADVVSKWTPDASVVMFGGNDVQGLWLGRDKWIRWHDEQWDEEYASRIDSLCELLAPLGQRVFWVGMPVMRPTKFHERVQRINMIARARMAARKGGVFIDTWDLLADEDGRYADKIAVGESPSSSTKVRVRAGDGIHLSTKGAEVLRDHVLSVLHGELGILPAVTMVNP